MTQQADFTAMPPEIPPVAGAVVVTLRVPAEFGCRSAQVAGDFTAWAPVVMRGEAAGGFSLMVCLPPGRSWQYRFLVDGNRWINDPSAEDYVSRGDGGAASVLHT